MLQTVPFSPDDIKSMKELPKTFWLTFLLLLIIQLPFSFLFGLLGLTGKGFGYWPTTIAFICFSLLVAFFILIKNYIAYKKDMTQQVKFSGELLVKSKTRKRSNRIIDFDSKQLKQLSLFSDKAFEKINEGDTIHLEVSKYSRYVFSMKKGNKSLLENN